MNVLQQVNTSIVSAFKLGVCFLYWGVCFIILWKFFGTAKTIPVDNEKSSDSENLFDTYISFKISNF